MSDNEFNALLAAHCDETYAIIEELLEDGSDPDALYTIEHHFSAQTPEILDEIIAQAFKLGYEITDPEELEVEDGLIMLCCDILSEAPLNADIINKQVEQLMRLAETNNANYDGWGTYFEDPNGNSDEQPDGFPIDSDDNGIRH